LGTRFGFVFVPARSFQHLLTIDLQRKSLQAIRRHLEPTGRLALHLFDPRLDLLSEPKTKDTPINNCYDFGGCRGLIV
jgi:hypothetical protein